MSAPRNYLKRGRPSHSMPTEHRPMTTEELRAYRASQPPDNRDLTARLLGDPPDYRSALHGLAAGRVM
jgi:hypothetical protein